MLNRPRFASLQRRFSWPAAESEVVVVEIVQRGAGLVFETESALLVLLALVEVVFLA